MTKKEINALRRNKKIIKCRKSCFVGVDRICSCCGKNTKHTEGLNMRILSIDPGPEKSAWLVYDCDNKTICDFDIFQNEDLRLWIEDKTKECKADVCVIEMVACYGMPVGRDVFETCVWIGRFTEAFGAPDSEVKYIYRKDVKMHLCNSMKAKDSNIRQVLIDKFGGSREKAIGTKNAKGPLYGIKKDLWQALALGVTYAEQHKNEK